MAHQVTDSQHNPTMALEALDLVQLYPGATQPALAGVSLSIAEGEIFGLLGPNGAGKTTAISIMASLLRPTSGTVSLFGVDVLRHPRDAQRLIGFVPQDIALYPELSARENLCYFGRLHGLSGQRLAERIEASLDLVSMSERADQRVTALSGGMKRRINLAVGLLNKPRLLFLDEPTVGIDAQSRNMILEKLVELQRAGTTLLYTTHYMEEAERLCTAVAIIDQGRLIARGKPRQLVDEAKDCETLQDLFFSLTGKRLRD